MRIVLLIFIFALSLQNLAAVTDSLQQDPEPYGGIEQLARSFFSIDFPIEIREKLDNQRIELIFYIDELGVPELEGVIGTDHPVVIDSFIRKTEEIPLFEAGMSGGQFVESYYVLILTYPSVEFFLQQLYWQRWREFCSSEYEDFQIIEPDRSGGDFILGVIGTVPTCSLRNYTGLGKGFIGNFTIMESSGWFWGFDLKVSYTPSIQPFPISSPNPPRNTFILGSIGIISGKSFDISGGNRSIYVQSNLSFTSLDVVKREGNNDPDWKNVKGGNLGIAIHYPILSGKPHLSCGVIGGKSINFRQLNLHVGLMGQIMNYKEANGLNFEVGISYRFRSRGIKNWELK